MRNRRCTKKIYSIHNRPTVRCSERAVMKFNDFDVLCDKHSQKFITSFPDQPVKRVFAVKKEA